MPKVILWLWENCGSWLSSGVADKNPVTYKLFLVYWTETEQWEMNLQHLFFFSLPWCVVSSACVIYSHCREKMPFGKFFNTSNLSCLGSELSPRSVWKRHCSQDGLLSIVCGSWVDSDVLVDYVPKEVWHTIYVFMCGTFEVSVQWTKASFLRWEHPGWVLTKWSDSITWKGGFVALISCC